MGGGALKNSFSLPKKINSIEKESKSKKKRNSLSEWYFEDWVYQSEGGKKEIYLVTKEGWVKKISPKIHGQKKRRLIDGKQIDKENEWFGSRKIPYSEEITHKLLVKVEDLEIFKKYEKNIKKITSKLNTGELQKLSEFFQDMKDNDKCELIDIFMECENFKDLLNIREDQFIRDGFQLNFEKLNHFTNKNWSNDSPKLSEILGKNGIIYITRLKAFENYFSSVINKWISEEIDRQKRKEKASNNFNGIYLLMKMFQGEEFGEGCSKYSFEEETKEIFRECLKETMTDFSEFPQNTKEEKYISTKVVDVIKAGNLKGSNPTYIPSSISERMKDKREGNKTSSYNWENFSPKIKEEVSNSFKKDGRWKGVLDTSCSNITSRDVISWLVSIVSEPIEKTGCYEFFNHLIFKKGIENKRWCLFEIEKTNSFIREKELIGPLVMANWNKGNRFWTKCTDFFL